METLEYMSRFRQGNQISLKTGRNYWDSWKPRLERQIERIRQKMEDLSA